MPPNRYIVPFQGDGVFFMKFDIKICKKCSYYQFKDRIEFKDKIHCMSKCLIERGMNESNNNWLVHSTTDNQTELNYNEDFEIPKKCEFMLEHIIIHG